MQAVKTINYPDGAVLSVYPDESPENPREWDNVSQMVCFHRRYSLGDKHDYRSEDFNGWDEIQAQIERDHDVALILPVYMYDHSGVLLATSPFSCPWDSGQVGFIFVTADTIRREFHCKRIGKRIRAKVEALMASELAVYNQYLNGEVYGFVLTDPKGEDEDSCWGFYGDDINENGMAEHLPEQYRKEVAERT